MTPVVAPAASVADPPASPSPSGIGVMRNSLIFGSVSFATYLLSLGKTILVSRYFGTSPDMDAFTVAILVPNLLGALITGSAAAGLVPALAKAGRDGRQQRSDAFRTSFTLVAAISALGTIVLALFARPMMHVVASAFDAQRLSTAVRLARWAAPLFLLNAVYAFASAELLARKKYALVAAAPAFSTLVSFALIAAFHRQGVAVLVWSLITGTAVQAAILLIPAWKSSAGGRVTRWRDPYVAKILAAQAPLLAASSIGVANAFVDQMMAAFLPAGNVSALSYATSLNGMAMQMVVMAMGWVMLPEISEIVAARDWARLRKKIRVCVIAVVMLAAPACLAVVGFGEQAIRVVFQHGQFRADSTTLVFLGWAGYSLGLVPAAIGMIAVRVANGLQENWLLFRIGIVLLIANAGLDYLLMRVAGILGITLSTTLVYCVSSLLVYRGLHRRMGALFEPGTGRRVLIAIVAATIAAVPALAIRLLGGSGMASSALGLVVFAAALALTYGQAGLITFHFVGRPWPARVALGAAFRGEYQ